MSTFDNPFDASRSLNGSGCACGRHVSQAEEARGTYDPRNVAVLRLGLPEPMIAIAQDPSAKPSRGQHVAAH